MDGLVNLIGLYFYLHTFFNITMLINYLFDQPVVFIKILPFPVSEIVHIFLSDLIPGPAFVCEMIETIEVFHPDAISPFFEFYR